MYIMWNPHCEYGVEAAPKMKCERKIEMWKWEYKLPF